MDLTITHGTHAKGGKPVSEVIHTNKKHPFLTVEKGFLPVGQIKLGMHVLEADGHVGVISGWKVVLGVKTMYNLEVAQDHTFVVGVGMWVVHNCSISNILSNAGKESDRGGLTKAGRAFQKHASRPGGDALWGVATGNPSSLNGKGQAILDQIINDPETQWVGRHHAMYGDIVEGRMLDGRGVRWSADDWSLIGFLNP